MTDPRIIAPFEFLLWYPTALVKCKCREEGTLIILINMHTPGTCPHCRKVYKAVGTTAEGGLAVDCQMPSVGGAN